ncbi:DUF169 domain-containing protein [Thermodesulfobacteriota bacterium]
MTNKYSRREVLGLGLGAAVLGAGSLANSASGKTSVSGQQEASPMTTLDEYHEYGEDLERILMLRSSPIAVKMLEKEEDIPKDAIRPKKDRGDHLAQCQAFAMSRRDGVTVAMLKEDHWCPTAVMAYGLVKKPESVESWSHPYDCFEYGKYIGIVTAPLKSTTFLPDVVITYGKPAQLRGLLLSMKVKDVPEVKHHFFPPSCGWSVVNPIKDGKYWVVLPDPGEYQRALTEEGDLMFSVPRIKMPEMMAGLRQNEHGPFSYRDHQMFMQTNFPLPGFYKEMFKSWGMDTE